THDPFLQVAAMIPVEAKIRIRSVGDDRTTTRPPPVLGVLLDLADVDARHEAQRGAELRAAIAVEGAVENAPARIEQRRVIRGPVNHRSAGALSTAGDRLPGKYPVRRELQADINRRGPIRLDAEIAGRDEQ